MSFSGLQRPESLCVLCPKGRGPRDKTLFLNFQNPKSPLLASALRAQSGLLGPEALAWAVFSFPWASRTVPKSRERGSIRPSLERLLPETDGETKGGGGEQLERERGTFTLKMCSPELQVNDGEPGLNSLSEAELLSRWAGLIDCQRPERWKIWGERL